MFICSRWSINCGKHVYEQPQRLQEVCFVTRNNRNYDNIDITYRRWCEQNTHRAAKF